MTPDQQFANYAAQIINSATAPVAEMANVQQTLLWLQQIAEGTVTIARPEDKADDKTPDADADGEAVGD